jgi:hypothetical protein
MVQIAIYNINGGTLPQFFYTKAHIARKSLRKTTPIEKYLGKCLGMAQKIAR